MASRYLDTSGVASSRTIVFVPSSALTSGSAQRTDQAIRLVKAALRKRLGGAVTSVPGGIAIRCSDADEATITRACHEVEQRLAKVEAEPLTSKIVEELLSVAPAELRRWSKDGRVPHSGNVTFGGGGSRKISLFVYSAPAISELAAHPERIAAWRQSDGHSR